MSNERINVKQEMKWYRKKKKNDWKKRKRTIRCNKFEHETQIESDKEWQKWKRKERQDVETNKEKPVKPGKDNKRKNEGRQQKMGKTERGEWKRQMTERMRRKWAKCAIAKCTRNCGKKNIFGVKTIISISEWYERERNAMNCNYFCCASRGGRQNLIPKLAV